MAVSKYIRLSVTTPSYGELTSDQIAAKSEDVHPGSDQQSKLTFIIRRLMGQRGKYYGATGKLSKESILTPRYLYSTNIPDTKGTAFMVWTYKASPQQKPEDLWIYLLF